MPTYWEDFLEPLHGVVCLPSHLHEQSPNCLNAKSRGLGEWLNGSVGKVTLKMCEIQSVLSELSVCQRVHNIVYE